VANTIDPETRTFRFRFPLDNQARTGSGSGKDEWRFRPGQRVRLLVRVERLENVFVLPAEAVARDGAEAYVFRRSGDAFDRKPVHVVYQDRRHAVVANDGSVPPGVHVATTGAAQLNRMAKAKSGAVPPGFHVHADGSVHAGNH
jgi:membrane fusion protein, heavy metal efflux system